MLANCQKLLSPHETGQYDDERAFNIRALTFAKQNTRRPQSPFLDIEIHKMTQKNRFNANKGIRGNEYDRPTSQHTENADEKTPHYNLSQACMSPTLRNIMSFTTTDQSHVLSGVLSLNNQPQVRNQSSSNVKRRNIQTMQTVKRPQLTTNFSPIHVQIRDKISGNLK